MGAYNFKPQFEQPIMEDLKRHTIRAKRKDGRRPKPGEVLSLYLGMRTKACRLMKRRRCAKVQLIEIHSNPGFWVVIDADKLTFDECDLLAKSDGFTDFWEMMQFWDGRLPFSGHLIHWESDAESAKNPIPEPKRKRPVTGSPRRANTRRARKKSGVVA